MPEEFWTREHLFYHNGDTIRKSLAEYKGKMLILDFWNTKCASCIAHQEEIDHFKAHFPAEIQVLMVNPSQGQDNYKLINDFYKLHQQKAFAKSGLTSIILDEDLRQIFPSRGFPPYVWLNKYGYYQLSTYRNLLSRKYFSPFID